MAQKHTKQEYISVAELCERVSVSKQAVYQRVNREPLRSYVRKFDGKKYLLKTAAAEHFSINFTDDEEKEDPPVNVQVLIEQLRQKDEQIKRLHDTVDKLTESLQRSQTLQGIAEQRVSALIEQLSAARDTAPDQEGTTGSSSPDQDPKQTAGERDRDQRRTDRSPDPKPEPETGRSPEPRPEQEGTTISPEPGQQESDLREKSSPNAEGIHGEESTFASKTRRQEGPAPQAEPAEKEDQDLQAKQIHSIGTVTLDSGSIWEPEKKVVRVEAPAADPEPVHETWLEKIRRFFREW